MHSTHIVCKQTLFWMWLIQLLSLYYIKLYYISSQDLNKHGILHCEYSDKLLWMFLYSTFYSKFKKIYNILKLILCSSLQIVCIIVNKWIN